MINLKWVQNVISVFYQAGYYHGDDCLLAADAVSEASSFLFSDALLFPVESSSLILGYFSAFGRDFKRSVQVLVASVADKVLVVFSGSAIGEKLHRFLNWNEKTYFLASTHSSKSQLLSGVSHLQFFRLHSPFCLLHPDCWQPKVSPALQS